MSIAHQRHQLVQLLNNVLVDGLSHVDDLKAVNKAVNCHEAVPVLRDFLVVELVVELLSTWRTKIILGGFEKVSEKFERFKVNQDD